MSRARYLHRTSMHEQLSKIVRPAIGGESTNAFSFFAASSFEMTIRPSLSKLTWSACNEGNTALRSVSAEALLPVTALDSPLLSMTALPPSKVTSDDLMWTGARSCAWAKGGMASVAAAAAVWATTWRRVATLSVVRLRSSDMFDPPAENDKPTLDRHASHHHVS